MMENQDPDDGVHLPDEASMAAALVGRTILIVDYRYGSSDGDNDLLTLTLDDGTVVTILGQWCNDSSGALWVEASPLRDVDPPPDTTKLLRGWQDPDLAAHLRGAAIAEARSGLDVLDRLLTNEPGDSR